MDSSHSISMTKSEHRMMTMNKNGAQSQNVLVNSCSLYLWITQSDVSFENRHCTVGWFMLVPI